MVVLQDLTQIRTHYPQPWKTFIGNAGMLNAFGVTDATTTRYLSQLLGNTTIHKARWTRLTASGMCGGDPGFNASPRSVPQLEPAEISLLASWRPDVSWCWCRACRPSICNAKKEN